jgi:hypothetical protein
MVRRLEMAYSGFIIVRFSRGLPISGDSQLSVAARNLGLIDVAKILADFNIEGTSRLVDAGPPSEATHLDAYWRVDVRRRSDDEVNNITARFSGADGVDLAYRELTAADPAVVAADPYADQQNYLDPAPLGIDARWVWQQANGVGNGVALVDVEQSWNWNHEDIVSKKPVLIHGDNNFGDHGTQVLGVILAEDNNRGIVGIAPGLRAVLLSSRYKAGQPGLHVASAIRAAIRDPRVQPGDVLLLEVVRLDETDKHWPTEVDLGDYRAIRDAVARGLIVIEAAGNSDRSLDEYKDSHGNRLLCRCESGFEDSGAIMVGACESQARDDGSHNRWVSSNYGTRVDCCAWGEHVVTCGVGDLHGGLTGNGNYTSLFNGTSSASAIIGGAALLLQSVYKVLSGGVLSPEQMRFLLSDVSTGTAQGPWRGDDRVGTMPNLRAVVEKSLLCAPDVYIRDNLQDAGLVPTPGPFSLCPDIIICPFQLDEPNKVLGGSSASQSPRYLGFPVNPTSDNHLYVRVLNRGLGDAKGVVATVYWSEVATLITRDMWKSVGTTEPLDVPKGAIRVTKRLRWRPPPGIRHCSFLAVLDHRLDPAPAFPPDLAYDDLRTIGRFRNNIAWRNYHIIRQAPETLPFHVTGANDRPRVFTLNLTTGPAMGTGSYLTMPLALWGRLSGGDLDGLELETLDTGHVRVPLRSDISLGNVMLGTKDSYECELHIDSLASEGGELAIRQLQKGDEVGRVTCVVLGPSELRKRPMWAVRLIRGAGSVFGRALGHTG